MSTGSVRFLPRGRLRLRGQHLPLPSGTVGESSGLLVTNQIEISVIMGLE